MGIRSGKVRPRQSASQRPESRLGCTLPVAGERVLAPGIDPGRASAILRNQSKWANGTELRYHFFDREADGLTVAFEDGSQEWRSWVGANRERQVVRDAFQEWKDLGIGLEFTEVDDREDAEVRIGFMQGDGSWSWVGRRLLEEPTHKRTMNFGWQLYGWTYGYDTALHEIGHTLGLPHEHQNPNAGLVWDEATVYTHFANPPNNWDRDTTYYNILRKIPAYLVSGSRWDPNSIMHYQFDKGLILDPARYQTEPLEPQAGLSQRDKDWIRTFYPPPEAAVRELTPFESQPLTVSPDGQIDFTIRPTLTRTFTIRTFGNSDSLMVLFENTDSGLRYRAADDDSGTDQNARLRHRLQRGSTYTLKIRVYHSQGSDAGSIMMW